MAHLLPTEMEDVLVTPLADVLARVGEGVAEAQRAMDLNSIATQTLINNDPVLSEQGLEATWYHMPEVNLEVKMSLELRRKNYVKNNRTIRRKVKMYASPFNASYQNNFKVDVSGMSKITAKIASVPPPVRSEPQE
ncbi:MAG TPA: hypothetical protein ENK35_13275 [Candidatus Tenderia sp.]|nr:hypothetical protein [Candidatus Tenderia sp.]